MNGPGTPVRGDHAGESPARPAGRHGGAIVADVIHAQGVRTVFTLIGGHVSPILTAVEARGIRVVDVRDEATAAFAARALLRIANDANWPDMQRSKAEVARWKREE